jgi:hypothetical protein
MCILCLVCAALEHMPTCMCRAHMYTWFLHRPRLQGPRPKHAYVLLLTRWHM